VRTSLWLIPLLCVLVGALLALLTLALDRASGYRWVPQAVTGTPTEAQNDPVHLCLGDGLADQPRAHRHPRRGPARDGQFSPRIVGALLTDRFSQLSIGLFGATFVVSVLTLREIQGSDTWTVPGLSVLLAYLLMLTSIVVLILFVHTRGGAPLFRVQPGLGPTVQALHRLHDLLRQLAPHHCPRESTATGTASCGWSSGR
jgi:uncharacterized membrane protein